MDRRVCRPTRQGWDFDPGGQQLPSRDSTVVLLPAKRGQKAVKARRALCLNYCVHFFWVVIWIYL